MAETPKWYVVHTYSGYENKVAGNIEKVIENKRFHDFIFDVSVPTETVVEVTDNKKREVENSNGVHEASGGGSRKDDCISPQKH